jgi:hypothetical protein
LGGHQRSGAGLGRGPLSGSVRVLPKLVMATLVSG